MLEFRPNTLYFGDNLEILDDFPSECVDLVYLDPPFNSNRSYNVLFKEAKGAESEAQIEAFEDTWHWDDPGTTVQTYDKMVARRDEVGKMLMAFVDALGHNDVTAYLTMMAPRLVELRRVMKPTASIYLHCDPTASHYLKVLMDAVFGVVNFRNEIVWQRTSAHSDVGQGAKHMGRIHDTLLFYSKSRASTWNTQYTSYSQEYADSEYRHVGPGGRRYKETDVTAAKPGGETLYDWRVMRPRTSGARWEADLDGEYKNPRSGREYKSVRPYRGRYWAFSERNLGAFAKEGRIIHRRTGMPRLMQFADEMPGVALQDIWTDIGHIGGSAEDQGYKTQKPEALLERIIEASSNPGDLVLDPFCGCGTATVAAHRLDRQWIGIDVTYVAVNLMRRRLLDQFPRDFPDGVREDGVPKDQAGVLALAKDRPLQFQYWAVAKLEGVQTGGKRPLRGADRGIDGTRTFPERDPDAAEKPTLDYKPVIISVKGGQTAGVSDLRDLIGVVTREDAAIGVLVLARQPTAAMKKEVAAAGLYRSTWDGSTYPRIQIITGIEIVHGKRIDMPSQRSTSDFTRAPVARERANQPRLSP